MSAILPRLPDRRSRSRSRRAFVLDPFTSPDALKLFEDGTAEMIAYGALSALFLANPHLLNGLHLAPGSS